MKNKKLVLAFSGGLDTSFCTHYLSQKQGFEVHAVYVNTGGYDAKEIQSIEQRALQLGAKSFKEIDAQHQYYEQCLRYLIYGNVLRNNCYPLSVSAERTLQAILVLEYAQCIGASAIAHGSTGAGNDQVRFDLIFQTLGSELQLISPIRDLQLSRQEEIAYLQENGIHWSWEKSKYSVNKGLWGTSVGGAETLGSRAALPASAYPIPVKKQQSEKLCLFFEKGELKKVNGTSYAHPVAAIQAIEQIAAPFGIGRDIHVGDTIIGIKGRVGFAAAAAMVIIKSHHLLEKHVLTKWQSYWKEQLANWYGMLLHEGQFLDPVMRNIEVFLQSTQETVSGEVFLKLYPHRFELEGIESANDLMDNHFGNYGEMNKAWTGEEAKGFIKLLANPTKIYHFVHQQKMEAL